MGEREALVWTSGGYVTSLRALLATTESKWGDISLTTKARLGPGLSSPHFGSKAESEQERLSFQLIYLLLEALGLYLLSSLYVHPRWNTLVGGWLPRLGKDFLCEVRLPQKSPAWPWSEGFCLQVSPAQIVSPWVIHSAPRYSLFTLTLTV